MFCNILDIALQNDITPIGIKELIYRAIAYLDIRHTYDYLLKANEIMKKQYSILIVPVISIREL